LEFLLQMLNGLACGLTFLLEYRWSHPVRRHLQEQYGYDRNGPGAAAGTFALPVTGHLRREEAEAIGHRATGSIGPAVITGDVVIGDK